MRHFALVMLAVMLLLAAGCLRQQTAQAPPPAKPVVQPTAAQAAPAKPGWGCVYQSEDGIYWLSLDEGTQPVKLRNLAANDVVMTASADGTKLAILGDAGSEVMDATTGAQIAYFKDDTLYGTVVACSPDSTAIAYSPAGKSLNVWRSGREVVLSSDSGIGDIAWSPDGTQIAYGRRNYQSDRDLGMFTIPAAGGESRQVVKSTNEIYSPSQISWAPDGKAIAFVHLWEDGYLGFVRSDGTGLRTHVAPTIGTPVWLGDSSAVVYMAGSETKSLGVYRCTSSGQPQEIVSTEFASFDMLPSGLIVTVEGSAIQPPTITVRSGPSETAPVIWSTTIRDAFSANGYLCPDGKAVAVHTNPQHGRDAILWMAPLGQPLTQRVKKIDYILGWAKR